jgi:hypothetical protein
MLPTRTVDVGWTTTASDVVFPLSPDIVSQATERIDQAARAYVRESTAALRLLGIPSAIWRLDFTINDLDGRLIALDQPQGGAFESPAGTVFAFEAEDRPLGIGLLSAISPDFRHRLARLLRSWPLVVVLVAPGLENDDHMWLGKDHVHHGLDELPDIGYLIIRADPGQTEYHPLAYRSWSTVASEGDKSYGARLGWWSPIHGIDELPDDDYPLVLKPRRGRRGEGLIIAAGSSGPLTPDMVSREQAEKALLDSPDGMYLQPWRPPLRFGDGNLILRVFFGYTGPDRWQCLGGAWALDNKAVVHGSETTIFGPAVPV